MHPLSRIRRVMGDRNHRLSRSHLDVIPQCAAQLARRSGLNGAWEYCLLLVGGAHPTAIASIFLPNQLYGILGNYRIPADDNSVFGIRPSNQ